jgi:hypothetical protein
VPEWHQTLKNVSRKYSRSSEAVPKRKSFGSSGQFMANALASNMEGTSLLVSVQTAVQYFRTVLIVRCHLCKDLYLWVVSLNIYCYLRVTSPAEIYQRHLWLDKQYFLGMDDRGQETKEQDTVTSSSMLFGRTARRLVRCLTG